MSRRVPDEELDVTTLIEDDGLLDRLGRGEPVADAGEVAAMLADWRATLPDTGPDDGRVAAALAHAPRPQGMRGFARVALGIAAGVVLACGGVTVAAAHAGPDSPLWPITRLVHGEEAESRAAVAAADRAVAEARVAVGRGRFGDASRLLDDAAALIASIRDPGAADRLRMLLAEVRALIPGGPGAAPTGPALPRASPAAPTSGSPGPSGVPGPSAVPVPQSAEPGRGTGVEPSTGAPVPTLTPSVPTLPVPTELVPRP